MALVHSPSHSHSEKLTNEPIASMDYWRGLAIISVVLFHFNEVLPFGYLGVDLFFVLSGFLVSRTLTTVRREEYNFNTALVFYWKRFTKILPSYYFFLLAGTGLCYLIYSESHPNLAIQGNQWWKFLFFFQNYRGTNNFVFDHAWSLCVEEHFYLVLPLALWVLHRHLPSLSLVNFALIGILLGWGGRTLSYSVGFETYSATHNRIDSLSWGILLAALEPRLRGIGFNGKSRICLLTAGAVGIFLVAASHLAGGAIKAIAFHGLTALTFFLFLGATYGMKVRALYPLQWLSAYSYNWYLWHLILVYECQRLFGQGLVGLGAYLVSGFLLAFAATHCIERPALKLRKFYTTPKN
jgi:peptidoglycan/LPS O-acetylase OafA/YrhL